MMSRQAGAIIGSAIVWAAVILATGLILDGTPYFAQMLPVVGGGAAASLILLGSALRKR